MAGKKWREILGRKQASPGLPDFSWDKIPKRQNICHRTTDDTKGQQHIPNVHKIY
jgi:hypothetical protein